MFLNEFLERCKVLSNTAIATVAKTRILLGILVREPKSVLVLALRALQGLLNLALHLRTEIWVFAF